MHQSSAAGHRRDAGEARNADFEYCRLSSLHAGIAGRGNTNTLQKHRQPTASSPSTFKRTEPEELLAQVTMSWCDGLRVFQGGSVPGAGFWIKSGLCQTARDRKGSLLLTRIARSGDRRIYRHYLEVIGFPAHRARRGLRESDTVDQQLRTHLRLGQRSMLKCGTGAVELATAGHDC